MTKKEIRNAKDIALLALVFFAGLKFSSSNNAPSHETGHTCTFDECPMQGMTKFQSEAEEGSDMYLMDLTHWNHPDWNSEQIEGFVFGIFDQEEHNGSDQLNVKTL